MKRIAITAVCCALTLSAVPAFALNTKAVFAPMNQETILYGFQWGGEGHCRGCKVDNGDQ